MRTTFAVGRLNSDGAEIVLLEDDVHPTFAGPWTLRAVVREHSPSPTVEDSVHSLRRRIHRDDVSATVQREGGKTVH